jgi:hypothetical protein
MAHNLLEPVTMLGASFLRELLHLREFIVDVVTETGRVDDGQGNTNTLLFEFYGTLLILYEHKTRGAILTDVDGLDPDALLYMRRVRAVRLFVGEHIRFTESVHEGGASSSGSTCKARTPSVSQRWV